MTPTQPTTSPAEADARGPTSGRNHPRPIGKPVAPSGVRPKPAPPGPTSERRSRRHWAALADGGGRVAASPRNRSHQMPTDPFTVQGCAIYSPGCSSSVDTAGQRIIAPERVSRARCVVPPPDSARPRVHHLKSFTQILDASSTRGQSDGLDFSDPAHRGTTGGLVQRAAGRSEATFPPRRIVLTSSTLPVNKFAPPLSVRGIVDWPSRRHPPAVPARGARPEWHTGSARAAAERVGRSDRSGRTGERRAEPAGLHSQLLDDAEGHTPSPSVR